LIKGRKNCTTCAAREQQSELEARKAKMASDIAEKERIEKPRVIERKVTPFNYKDRMAMEKEEREKAGYEPYEKKW